MIIPIKYSFLINLFCKTKYCFISCIKTKMIFLLVHTLHALYLFQIFGLTTWSRFSCLVSKGYSGKNSNWGWGFEDILFWTPLWNFTFFYFTYGNSRESKAQTLDIPQNCVRSLGNSKAKNKGPRNFRIIFSWSPFEIPLCF